MGDTGSGLGGAVDAVEHVGKQLYAQAMKGASQLGHSTAGAAGSLGSEVGESAFAHAIKDGRRPPDSLWQHLDDWYDFHTGMHQDLNEAIERSKNFYAPQFAQALQGQAGDALQAKLRESHQLWGTHADSHQGAGLAAYQASGIVQNAQSEIDRIAEDGEREFHDAVQRRDPLGALQVWRTYSGQADDVVARTAPKVTSVIQAAGFDIPLDTPPKPGDGNRTDSGNKKPEVKPVKNEHHPDGAHTDGQPGDGSDGTHNDLVGNDGNPLPGQPLGYGTRTDMPLQPGQSPFMPANLGSGGGGLGSGGGGGSQMPSLGSGLPSQMSGMGGMGGGSPMGGLGAPTSPASAMPQAPAASPGAASPLANASSSFQSGLASGMGASGGMGSAPPPVQPQQPMAATQPPVAAPSSAGMGPAGVPASSSWSGPADSAGATSGHGASGTGGLSGGGGAMMPPSGMAAQPLAPYSPPGAGAAGGGSPSAPTTPAGGGSAGQGAPSGGAGAAGGPAGPPPMLTGNPGSSAAMSALAGSSTDGNPDLLTAQRVLGELVRGSEDSSALVLWAVAVLRSPVGSHIVVANNVGGGGYLPQQVYLPTTVRLAVSDPSLPIGWADVWMGCQKPSKILVDYFDRLRKVIAGVSVSALVTTELWAEPPQEFGGDFLGIEHRDALRLVSEAPKLDAAHLHRLAVVDPGLAQRVNSLDRGGDVSARCAAVLTGVLFQAATNPDGTGAALVEKADADILQAVSNGTVNPETWAAYDREVDQRHGSAVLWPQQHAPSDNDGSAVAQASILWYAHYYRIGRMIELIRCWKSRPPRLVEVAYCGVMAGFGPTVVDAIGAMEQQLRQR